mgnify:CR=1 FL=1
MNKKVFFSFHYDLDSWRVNQVRNMGIVEGQRICEPNEWEKIKQQGDKNIEKWIDDNMKKCDCVIVLIGEKTHERKWVRYEVQRAKEIKKPVFGIFIHILIGKDSRMANKGQNVFDIYAYEPENYNEIREKLGVWIENQCNLFRHKHTLPTERD